MKKYLKVFVCLLLVSAMILSSAAMAFAEEPEQETVHLLTLGDSNVAGMGLMDYATQGEGAWGYLTRVNGSFADRFAAALEERGIAVDLAQMAIPGIRTYDLRALIEPEYPLDAYFVYGTVGTNQGSPDTNTLDNILNAYGEEGLSYKSKTQEEKRAYISPYYVSAIEQANIITIELGDNDIYAFLPFIMGMGKAPNLEEFIRNYSSNPLYQTVVNQMTKAFKTVAPKLYEEGGTADSQSALLMQALLYGVLDGCFNFDAIVKRIYELNEDAELIVLSVNPALPSDLVVGMGEMGDVPVGRLLGICVDVINEYRAGLSPYASEYLYADTSKRFPVQTFMEELDKDPDAFDPMALSSDMKNLLLHMIEDPRYLNVSRDFTAPTGQFLDSGFEDYSDIVERIQYAYSYKRMGNPMGGGDYASAVSKYYCVNPSHATPIAEMTEEEMALVAEYTTLRLIMVDANAAPHANRKGHQAKADAAVYALDQSESARLYSYRVMHESVTELKQEVRQTVDAISEAAFEVRIDVLKGIKTTLTAIGQQVKNTLEKIIIHAYNMTR